jgi:uncharacterized protein YbjT (DUF2867 family)
MKILVTGATGLVGRALTNYLRSVGNDVYPFARPTDWNPDTGSSIVNVLKDVMP